MGLRHMSSLRQQYGQANRGTHVSLNRVKLTPIYLDCARSGEASEKAAQVRVMHSLLAYAACYYYSARL